MSYAPASERPLGRPRDPFSHHYASRAHTASASDIRALFAVAARPGVISLAGGMPGASALPVDAVADLAARLLSSQGAVALQYATAHGDPRLREKICDVMALEGIRARADDVVVTVGSQQALDLVARIFIDPGDVVLAEAPSYVGALGVFSAFQAEVVHVPMDDGGLVPDALDAAIRRLGAAGRRPKLLYTVPNFHNPAGVTLLASRRGRILDICASAGLLIIEDNPYGLLGFAGAPARALYADNPDGVLYLGTFSKIFAPGVRVGWAAAPPAVRDKLLIAAESAILCHSSLAQLLVREYLCTYSWQRHVAALRDVYRQRRDAMLAALDAVGVGGCGWTTPAGGFYVWLRLPDGIDATAMLPRAVASGVAYVPGTGFYAGYANGQGASHLRLSYCFPEPDHIHEAIRRLATVIEAEHQHGHAGSPATAVRS